MTTDTETRPDYLTVRELAELLRIKERKVYDLAASGEVPCIKVTGKLLFSAAEIRSWIARARSGGKARGSRPPVFLGSHDPLLDWAIRQSRCGLATLLDGSHDGLARFVAGEGAATGLHIHDPATREWNVPAVRAACAGENAVLVAWAKRSRGLVVRNEDARSITRLEDLRDRRIITRQPESGAHALFESCLADAGIGADDAVYCQPARSENDAVLAVVQSVADAAFGLEALARHYGLHFVPIMDERFDILVDRAAWFERPIQELMSFAGGSEFRDHARNLSGYDISALGEVRWNA